MSLSDATPLPPGVTPPGYDRRALRPGIVHLGFGAFHRAHQAVATQAALRREFGPWGIVAVKLRSAGPIRDLAAQDGLYSVTTRGPDGDSTEVIGATVGWSAPPRTRRRCWRRWPIPASASSP